MILRNGDFGGAEEEGGGLVCKKHIRYMFKPDAQKKERGVSTVGGE